VSLIDHIPGLKGTGSHRAADRIAELEELVGQLREENVKLHNRQAAADDFFMIQDQYATDLEAELAQEKRTHAATRTDLQARNRWVRDLEGRLADAERRLDIRKLAETAAERTQEMPVITPVVPLHQSPQAVTDPGQVA
jgi:chromosome segregation ATPase